MKNKLFYSILTLSFVLLIQSTKAQKTYNKIIYKKKTNIVLQKAKKDESAGSKAAGEMLKNSFSKMNTFEYALKFNNNASIFSEIPKMEVDIDKNPLATTLARLAGGTDGIFYTDRKTGKVYVQKENEAKKILVEHAKITDWKLTQETKKIGKYTCYKATKNDSYVGSSGNLRHFKVIAWYTLEIPYPYGPIKYNGLPGLILELSNNFAIIYANKIFLNQKHRLKIKKPKGRNITRRRYDSIQMGLATGLRKILRHK